MTLEGRVVLGFVINENGKTEDVRILEFQGKGFAEGAVAAVNQWRYKPALYKGEPFSSHVNLTLDLACRKNE